MYMNTAYLKNTLVSPRTPMDQADLSVPLKILCCGIYRIRSFPHLDTERPNGRKDYQLLYFHAGQGHFYFDGLSGKETIVHAGHMILFAPKDPQMYYYYASDRTEVYWVHFTGNSVLDLLAHYGLPTKGAVFKSNIDTAYKNIFLDMITELQLCKTSYEEMLVLMLKRLFLLIQRNRLEKPVTSTNMQKIIGQAIRYFNENYNKHIVIQDYASQHFLTPCWFIRNFKQQTGLTPAQYIASIRMANAQSLLENQQYTVQEVANMVGYEDALYFSRTFKKHTGYSPKEYRAMIVQEE